MKYKILFGWINLDKPAGITSAKLVAIIRSLLKIKKIGHGGTLDPFATGVLPIAVGEATKTVNFIQDQIKEYEFTLKFGTRTDSGDVTGKVIETNEYFPSEKELKDILPEFIGDILQKPPIYSAIKVNGRRAYEIARSGEIPELKERIIRINELTIVKVDTAKKYGIFKVTCGKGTYIRSLGEDIAKKLCSCAHVESLTRTRVGYFNKKNIISLEKLEKLVHNGNLKACMISICEVLDDIPALDFSKSDVKKIKNGIQISLPKDISNEFVSYALAKDEDIPAAIGKIENLYFKPIRVFNIN